MNEKRIKDFSEENIVKKNDVDRIIKNYSLIFPCPHC